MSGIDSQRKSANGRRRSTSSNKGSKLEKKTPLLSSSDDDSSGSSFRSSSNFDSLSRSSSSSSDSLSNVRSASRHDSKRSTSSLSRRASKSDDKLKNSRRALSKSSLNSSSASDAESTRTDLSRPNSLKNLEAEYDPIATNLPFNVYQTLFSIKSSNLKIYTLTKEYQENQIKLSKLVDEVTASQLKDENRKLADQMVVESCGSISLVEVIYGSIHWKLAKEHTNLALIYLETKNLPRQAKVHCERAWSILVEDLKHKRSEQYNENVDVADDGLVGTGEQQQQNQHNYPDCNRHQMILNYVYGRASSLLKENDVGQSALESADEYCKYWQQELKSNKSRLIKFKGELNAWKQKIYYALAKQCAINGSDRRALEHYNKCLDVVNRKKARTENFADHETLIKIYKDMSKVELSRGGDDKEGFLKAVDYAKMSIEVAEQSGSIVYIGESKLHLAKMFAQKDDMNSSNNAEELFVEVVGSYTKATEGAANRHAVKAKDELVKFYLKEHRYDDAVTYLNELVKEKAELYGDFSIKLDSNYKLLCSIYLVKNDMPSAAKYLQKSLEIEEINYGTKDKRYLETKDMLDNLKKNPNVKTGSNENDTKPVFHVKQKIDYSKSDYKLFSPLGSAEQQNVPLNDSSPKTPTASTSDDSFVKKKITPIK